MAQGEGGGGGSGIIPPIGYGPLGLEIGGFGIGLGGQFGLDLGVFGTIGFEGVPRAAKSKRAAHVFLSSPDPALRKLGFELMRFVDQGGVLSTGNDADRRRLGSFVHQAVLALEAQGLPRGEAFRHISNTISYGTPIPVPHALSRGPETGPSSPSPNARGLDWFTRQLNKLPAAGFGAGLAAFEVTGQPEAPLIGYLVGQELKEVGTGLDNFARSFERQPSQPQQMTPNRAQPDYPQQYIPPNAGQPSQPQQFIPPTSPQRPEVPTLEDKDCPECGYYTARQRQQHDTLEDELRIERQQDRDNQDDQRQQRIDDLRAQERLPSSQRDIPREIAQKQQMLRDIDTEARGGGTPVGPGNPPYPTGGTPTLQEPPPPPPLVQRQPHPDHSPDPNDPQAVKFCVQCASQGESLKFLNGEPSECSVVV